MAKKISIIRRLRKKSNISKKSSQVGGSKIKKNTFKKQKRKSKSHIRRKNNKKKYQRSKKNNKKLNFQLGGTDGGADGPVIVDKEILIKFLQVCTFIDFCKDKIQTDKHFKITLNSTENSCNVKENTEANDKNEVILFDTSEALDVTQNQLSALRRESSCDWESLLSESEDEESATSPAKACVARSPSHSTDTDKAAILYFNETVNPSLNNETVNPSLNNERMGNLIQCLVAYFCDQNNRERHFASDDIPKVYGSLYGLFETEVEAHIKQKGTAQPDAMPIRLAQVDNLGALLEIIKVQFEITTDNIKHLKTSCIPVSSRGVIIKFIGGNDQEPPPGAEHFRLGCPYTYINLITDTYNVLHDLSATKTKEKQQAHIKVQKDFFLNDYMAAHADLRKQEFVKLFNAIMNLSQPQQKFDSLTFILGLIHIILILRIRRQIFHTSINIGKYNTVHLKNLGNDTTHRACINKYIELAKAVETALTTEIQPGNLFTEQSRIDAPVFKPAA